MLKVMCKKITPPFYYHGCLYGLFNGIRKEGGDSRGARMMEGKLARVDGRKRGGRGEAGKRIG